MINNPDIQPNATINRWIAGILLFDFKLRHVPGKDHTPADGLSRRAYTNDDKEDIPDDDWIDRACAFAMECLNRQIQPLAERMAKSPETPTRVQGPGTRLKKRNQNEMGEEHQQYRSATSPKTFVQLFTTTALAIPRSDKAR